MSKGHDVDDILREIQQRKKNKYSEAERSAPTKVAPDYQPSGGLDNHDEVQVFDRSPGTAPAPRPMQPPTSPKTEFEAPKSSQQGTEKKPFRIDMGDKQSGKPSAPSREVQGFEREMRPTPKAPPSQAGVSQQTQMFTPQPSGEWDKKHTLGEEQNGEYEGSPIENDDVLEFRAHSDARTVWQDFAHLKKGLTIRFLATFMCAIGLLYLALSYEYPLPLPPFIWPESDLRMFFVANLVLLVLTIILSANTIGGGLISLFTLKADNDSFAAIAAIGGLTQAVALVVNPESFATGGWHFYMLVVALILMFNTIGKLSMAGRMINGFRTIAGDRRAKFATAQIGTKDIAREMTRGQNLDVPYVSFPVRTDFFADYLMLSYEEDYSDEVSKMLAPVTFAACVLMAFISFFFSRSAFGAITVFAAAGCVAAPFGATLVGNLPMGRMAKRLAKNGCMVPGYGAVERLGRTNAVLMNCSELFPSQNITLHKMRVFQKNALEQAILDAASVICSCESTLGGIFSQMIGDHPEMLRTAESLIYEDGMGLSAWVDGKRVLIGNRELMHQHGIGLPPHDYESQFYNEGYDLLYLANSGELTAVYVLSYNADEKISMALEELHERDITLVVYTTDPNITPKMIQDVFAYPAELIKVLPAKLHEQVKSITAQRPRSRAYAAHNGSVEQFVDTMVSAEGCQRSVLLGTALQLFFVVAGFALVTFMAFMQNMGEVSWLMVIAFQLVGCALSTLIPILRR